MTRETGPDRPLTISFLDRLAEHSGPPGRADYPGGPTRHTVRPEVLRWFLRRDLTWLLNTRPVRPTSPNDIDGAAMGDTLLTYGLSEVAPRGSRSGRDRELCATPSRRPSIGSSRGFNGSASLWPRTAPRARRRGSGSAA